jgi:phosphoribosyl-ATP pyrophosphohydrolase/phosphoribosyl-AMP cyclohydrolase
MPKFQPLIDPSTLKYDQNGLIPAVIQEQIGGKVLMLAYMNRESLEKTLETGTTWFYSRSRQKLWNKGETSGHIQEVVEAYFDCDADSLLFKVRQTGPACHTGEYSCFHQPLTDNSKPDFTDKSAVLREVFEVIMQRKRVKPEGSYVAKKMDEGIDRILKKVGEEAGEVIIAAKNGSADEIGWEMADLIFHMWLTLGYLELSPDIIYDRLMERRK